MNTLLDKRLPDGRGIVDALFAALPAGQNMPTIIDVGARNGFFLLPPSYTSRSAMLGFEPNREEYDKLVTGTTDAQKFFGWNTPFKETRFHPYAVWHEDGEFDFYITNGPGACTMMGPTTDVARDLFYLYPKGDRRLKSFEELHSGVVRTTKVECRRLDALVDRNTIIDFLKLDVEGGEANVLAGTKGLLANNQILAVRAEFQMLHYYREHPLLHVQHRILDEAGFRLIDLDTAHIRYRQGRFDLPDDCNKGMLVAGDALYVRDPYRSRLSPPEMHRLGILCISLWYNSFGLALLERAGLLPKADIEAIYRMALHTPMMTWRGRAVRAWGRIPYAMFDFLTALKRRLVK
jgi:FkbM family methyltransferase